jgi:integrase
MVELAIAAWLHAKGQKSQSAKTLATYAPTLQAFRAQLQTHGLDLDDADPRVARRRVQADVAVRRSPGDMAAGSLSGASSGTSGPFLEAQVEELVAAHAATIALLAQRFAAHPTPTRFGPRPVAAATTNVRLATLSSFYVYALRQDLLRGVNPIARLERRTTQRYAGAVPLPYAFVDERLRAIDRATLAGMRDYALLLTGLHTGRRLSELAGLRWGHITVHGARLEIVWPKSKGGKVMRDILPTRGRGREPARALLDWMRHAYPPGDPDEYALTSAGAVAPVWVSLARNGTAGHALSVSTLADICAKRLGVSTVHTLRHTFARALDDAGAKVSEIQAHLGHASLDTTGRYLAQLGAGENRHLARLSKLYGLETSEGESS